MKEILRINVIIDKIYTVTGAAGEAAMILFHGSFSGEHISGNILPGAVDTQIQTEGQLRSLSARYILEGKDINDTPFHMFIENNGICNKDGNFITHPSVFTDNAEFQWMEKEALVGTVGNTNDGNLLIKIYRKADYRESGI